jgi:hypothetical protein
VWRPIRDRLQSSYADVEAEVSHMFSRLGGRVIFTAGDGLTLMRMNHLLSGEPETYVNMSEPPICIPLQGVPPAMRYLQPPALHISR